jgi:hypothetical protein
MLVAIKRVGSEECPQCFFPDLMCDMQHLRGARKQRNPDHKCIEKRARFPFTATGASLGVHGDQPVLSFRSHGKSFFMAPSEKGIYDVKFVGWLR